MSSAEDSVFSTQAGADKGSEHSLPLVSIITTIFNAKNEIKQVIDSVQSQSYPAKEHIIIDGGSNDGTIDILNEFDNKIDYWRSERDFGIFDAMNKGLDAANGEWICFLGADDKFYRNDTLETVFKNTIFPKNVLLLYGNILKANGRLFRSRFNNLLYIKNTVHHQGAFYNCKIFEQFRYGLSVKSLPGNTLFISGDYQLNLKLFIDEIKSYRLEQIIAVVRDDLSGRGLWRGYFEEIKIRHEYLNSWIAFALDFNTIFRFIYKKLKMGLSPQKYKSIP